MNSKAETFKKFLQKIGSGEQTSKSLSREESKEALRIILNNEATPAQIGAFMIAHRIRRPTPIELAGMLDIYLELGPILKSSSNQKPPICFGIPFDGRTKTSPIYPLTVLTLLALGQTVVLHGGKRMPTKYGVSTKELFESLGLDLSGLGIKKVQDCLNRNGFAFIYQPDHFSLAENINPYREEIGKRPPIATMELLWSAHRGQHILINGFVHKPTEEKAWQTHKLLGEESLITIKGLEGGTDIPISRPCIAGRFGNNQHERLILKAQDYDLKCSDPKWHDINQWKQCSLEALEGKGPYLNPLLWNCGVYLWLCGVSKSITQGIDKTITCIEEGKAYSQLKKLIEWRESEI